LKEAYEKLEEDVKNALKEHRGNQSAISVALNALLLYPDRPFHLGNLFGWEFDPETQRREKFLIAQTADLLRSIAACVALRPLVHPSECRTRTRRT
jgi:hypothetical protein